MRRTYIVAMAALVLVLGAAPAALAGPKIAFDQEAVDYGQVAFDEWVTHRFRYTNVGDEPLQINGRFCHDVLIRAKALEGC